MRTPARAGVLVGAVVMALLGATGVQAHTSGYHWNRYGSTVTIPAYTTGTYADATFQAANDWSNNTILYIPQYPVHTDLHLFDANYGNTGWLALTEYTSLSGTHILHGHGRLNTYYRFTYADAVAIRCNQIGRLVGLVNDGYGCMGGGLSYTVQHNWDDIHNMYRYTHH
ncbi:MAG TPA: hypothetical protein VFZ32_01935 [Micromonosporaceae bacterium]